MWCLLVLKDDEDDVGSGINDCLSLWHRYHCLQYPQHFLANKFLGKSHAKSQSFLHFLKPNALKKSEKNQLENY